MGMEDEINRYHWGLIPVRSFGLYDREHRFIGNRDSSFCLLHPGREDGEMSGAILYVTGGLHVSVSSTTQHQPQARIDLPDTVTSSGAKLVYLYLAIENEATIDELHAALGMKKLTLYSLLRTLTSTDRVDRAGTTYVCQEQTTHGRNP